MKIYLLLTTFLGLGIGILILWLIRKDHLHVKYAFSWILIAVLWMLLGLFPGIIDVLANWLYIGYPPILAVVLAISFLLVKLLLNDIERSRQSRHIIRLNQRLSLLETQLKQYHNNPEHQAHSLSECGKKRV